MILTLTPNPSVDRTVELDALVRGEVLRATGTHVDPGGKGINVSRALAANGLDSQAVLPVGGAVGDQLVALLYVAGIDVLAVPVSGDVRANISVVEPDGTVTKINEPGPTLTSAETQALVDATSKAAVDATWVVAAGSLPPGAAADLFAVLGRALAEQGVRYVVDSSGAALELALLARPALVKPNREELIEVSGLPVRTVGEAVTAARAVRDRGARAVLASLGASGAVLVEGDQAWYAVSPVAAPVSSVGAGDATLAGFLAAGGTGPEALREALAWGAAAVRLPGSRMPAPTDLDRAAVRLAHAIPSDLQLGA
ncbi:MAG: 1-phosphofructokinase [Mycobacteriales bacterium]